MNHSTRILSERHFRSRINYSDHLVSLHNVIFLVKDKITDTLSYTQYYLPHCRPIKAYLHGFDITRFLVHRSNLTNYSYYFLNYAYSIGFTIKDVRAYFKGFQAVTSKQPDVKKLMERGVKKTYQRTEGSTKAMNSQQLAEASRTPFDATSPGVKMYGAMKSNVTPVTVNFTKQFTAVFKDERVFRAALRLACNRVTRFKILETNLELKHSLLNAGLKKNGLLIFRSYLMEHGDFVQPLQLLSMLNEFAATNGWFSTGAKSFGEDSLKQSFTMFDLKSLGLTLEMLPGVMFPEDWDELSPVKRYDFGC